MTTVPGSRLNTRRALAVLALATVMCAGACTSDDSTDPTSAPSAKPSTAHERSTHAGPDFVDADAAGAVRVAAISAHRKAVLQGQNVSFTTYPLTPADSGGTGDRTVLRAARTYTVHDDVYVLRGTFGISVVAKNATVSGLKPFLGTAGHVYRVTAMVTPLPGKGTFTLQTLDARNGRRNTSTTTPFVAR